jgi:hypothetical protein
MLFLRMKDDAQFNYQHPGEMVWIKFPRIRKQKSIKCPKYSMPSPLWSLTLIGVLDTGIGISGS